MTGPFIKKFTQDKSFYIYDVNTNQIVEVEEKIFKNIDDFRGNAEDNRHEITQAQKEHGLFSNFRPDKVLMGPRTASDIRELHNKNLDQLILELSNGCNLSCSYCPVSGKYTTIQYKKSDMSSDICFNALEFFHTNSLNTEAPYISFYGGEPLTRFDLIKDSVNFIRQKSDGDKYCFSLTTNGTLLNREIVDFLKNNNFHVNISLDGPEHVHDRYRVTRDGKGSFITIKESLELIKNHAPVYYSNNVSIACVITPPFDYIDDILYFFLNDEVIRDIRIKGRIKNSFVNPRETDFLDRLDLRESAEKIEQIRNLFSNRLKKAILSRNLASLTIEKRPMERLLYNLATRPINKLYPTNHPFGACHIGLRRVFVKTNGDFHVCERSGGDYKIGQIDTGFDFEQIAYYYRKLEEVLEDCRNCWAICHCERCWIRLGNLEKFKGEKKENFCQSQKHFIEKAFKLYVSLLKKDPDCLKILRESV